MMDLDTVYVQQYEMNDIHAWIRDYSCSTANQMVVEAFENKVQTFLETDMPCIAVNSGTEALFLLLSKLGVGKGATVAVPALRFIALDNAILRTGAEVVHVDVYNDTWTINEDRIPDGVTHICPVHLYGNPAEVSTDQVPVIYDGAQALGSKDSSRYVSGVGNTIMSFNGNKMITTGAGGMIFADQGIIDHLNEMNNQGHYNGIGINSGMPAWNAALGLSQMDLLSYRLKNRAEINGIYRDKLGDIITFQSPNGEPNWWYSAGTFENRWMREIMEGILQANVIPYRRIFEPPEDVCDDDPYPDARYVYDTGICLPAGHMMKDKDVARVCDTITHAYDLIKHMSHNIVDVKRIIHEYKEQQ